MSGESNYNAATQPGLIKRTIAVLSKPLSLKGFLEIWMTSTTLGTANSLTMKRKRRQILLFSDMNTLLRAFF